MGSNALGAWVSNPSPGMSFTHPWQPVLVYPAKGTYGLRFQKGVVENLEPTINGKPMSGVNGVNPPILKLDPSQINASTGESWAVLEVTPNATGGLDATCAIQIVHSNNTTPAVGATKGRIALVCIQWKAGFPQFIWPAVFFNMSYTRTGSDAGGYHHYFL